MLNVILYRPEIAQNTGNIMRTCAAIGAKLHIIGPLPFSLDDEFISRSGMDYIHNMEYVYYDSLEEFDAKNKGIDIYYVTRYASKNPTEFNLSDPSLDYYVMFGRESTGIPLEVLKAHKDQCIRIPMKPFARSLNLANSVAIIVYEIMRQQNYYGLASKDNLKGDDYL